MEIQKLSLNTLEWNTEFSDNSIRLMSPNGQKIEITLVDNDVWQISTIEKTMNIRPTSGNTVEISKR